MKLSEKIYYCRKKSGKSQEALAEQLGVSRQAVSKWETGDSEPEISKLKLLADAFGVTVDWLLSDEEPAGEPGPAASTNTNRVDSVPGVTGALLHRFRRRACLYQALAGVAMILTGVAVLILSPRVPSFDKVANSNPFSDLAAAVNRSTAMTCTLMIAGGILLTVFGVIRTVILKKRNRG